MLLFSASSCSNDEPDGPESPITPDEPTLPAGAVTWEQPFTFKVVNDAIWINCGGDTITALDIPAEININGRDYPVTTLEKFYGLESLKSLRIPPTIKRIVAWDAFNSSDISDLYIEDIAAWCGIYFPIYYHSHNTGTDAAYLSNPIRPNTRLYLNGQLVETLVIPGTVESVSTMAFMDLSFKSLEVQKGVKFINDHAFYNCAQLKEISFPEGLKAIDTQAFSKCTALSDIRFREGLVSIGTEAFYNCSNLDRLSLPESLESLGDFSFAYCSKLEHLSLPDSLKTIGKQSFLGCENLKDVKLPPNPTFFGSGAFSNTRAFLSGGGNTFTYTLPPTLNHLGSGFFGIYGKYAYQRFNIPSVEWWLRLSTDGQDTPTYLCVDGQDLTHVDFPETMKYIPDGLMRGIVGLRTITLPNTLQYIGKAAFSGCKDLISLRIPDGQLKRIKYQTFRECTALETVEIGEGVDHIEGWAFAECTSLMKVTLPSTLEYADGMSFDNCYSLREIYLKATTPPKDFRLFFDDDRYNQVTLYVPRGSLELYQNKGFPYNLLKEIVEYDFE